MPRITIDFEERAGAAGEGAQPPGDALAGAIDGEWKDPASAPRVTRPRLVAHRSGYWRRSRRPQRRLPRGRVRHWVGRTVALPRQKETEPSRSAVLPDALMHVAMSFMV
jgi:hypothetical protein